MRLKAPIYWARASLLLSVWVALLAACQAPASEHREGEHELVVAGSEGAASGLRRSPIVTRLYGPKSPRKYTPVKLWLELDRKIPLGAEVSIDLVLPRGVTLAHGTEHTRLARNRAATRDRLAFDLTVRELPEQDLVVVIEARGEGYGYHARLPYRFGRPAPVARAPEARGRELRVAGKSFGRSVIVGTSE